MCFKTVVVLGKKYLGAWPSSFGRQQRLSEITIEPIKNLEGLGKIWGACTPLILPRPPKFVSVCEKMINAVQSIGMNIIYNRVDDLLCTGWSTDFNHFFTVRTKQ